MAKVIEKSSILMVIKAGDVPLSDLKKKADKSSSKAKEKKTATSTKTKKQKSAASDVAVNDVAPEKKKRTKKAVVQPEIDQGQPLEILDAVSEVSDQPIVVLKIEEEQASEIVAVVPEVLEQPLEPVKEKKILPPIPKRSAEEYQASRERYKLEEERLLALLPRRIPASVGPVAANLTRNRPFYLASSQQKRITKALTNRLLAEPSIAIPTWEVLMDNGLTIRQKVDRLQEIGWEPEVMPNDKFKFERLFKLARIMEKGII